MWPGPISDLHDLNVKDQSALWRDFTWEQSITVGDIDKWSCKLYCYGIFRVRFHETIKMENFLLVLAVNLHDNSILEAWKR